MNNSKTNGERLETLETSVALQDRTVEELSTFIVAQQKQIADLEKKVELLALGLKGRKETLPNSGASEDIPPPHYGQV